MDLGRGLVKSIPPNVFGIASKGLNYVSFYQNELILYLGVCVCAIFLGGVYRLNLSSRAPWMTSW